MFRNIELRLGYKIVTLDHVLGPMRQENAKKMREQVQNSTFSAFFEAGVQGLHLKSPRKKVLKVFFQNFKKKLFTCQTNSFGFLEPYSRSDSSFCRKFSKNVSNIEPPVDLIACYMESAVTPVTWTVFRMVL